jgi:hypothetical protein
MLLLTSGMERGKTRKKEAELAVTWKVREDGREWKGQQRSRPAWTSILQTSIRPTRQEPQRLIELRHTSTSNLTDLKALQAISLRTI